MHDVTVNVTSIEWDTSDAPEAHKPLLHLLPATYGRLTVTVDDGSNDEEILCEVLNALVNQFGYLITDVQFIIESIHRVQD
jgi:hypothetical protein